MDIRTQLINCYLDYRNNYLTADVYSEHNGLTTEQGKAFLELASQVFNSPHPEA